MTSFSRPISVFKPLSTLKLVLLPVVLLLGACAAPPEPGINEPDLDPQQQQGKNLYSIHCAACHSLSPDTVVVGPSLDGIATRAADRVEGMTAEQYLQVSILKPGAYLVEGFEDLMPADLAKRLSGEEFDALVTYLLVLQ